MIDDRATCALCLEPETLQESHIIPAFVYDWLRETSVSGFRTSGKPNLRTQDGWKVPLLCRACEGRLSRWERQFAEQIFKPVHAAEHTPLGLRYHGDWMLKFCVSVSWRVFTAIDRTRELANMTPEQLAACRRAADIWRRFLLGELPHPGPFEQHLLPGDVGLRTDAPISPFINRYIGRCTDLDVAVHPREAFAYAKLGRLLLFGFLVPHERIRQEWQGLKVNLNAGPLEPWKCVRPASYRAT